MAPLLIGYVRVSTNTQDLTAQREGLTAQREGLTALGVAHERIYVDHGPTGTNRERPGLREAMAACRAGDTLVVTRLDRLARSLPDAREIPAELTRRRVSPSLGGAVHDPTDPVGRLLFNVLAMVVPFTSGEFDGRGVRSTAHRGLTVELTRRIMRWSSALSARKWCPG